MKTSNSILLCFLGLLACTLLIRASEEVTDPDAPICANASDVARWAFMETVHVARNDSEADSLDMESMELILDAVHEVMGCHEEDCKVGYF